MAVLGQNNCSPARIYGPLSPHLFCGCSVKSWSITAGWNEQSSSITIDLVEDACAGNRVWWDETLARQSSSSMADPGFTYPEPGLPAYFRIEEDPDGATEALRGGFEYAGIIEGWTEKVDPNGNPVFTVKMTDPRVIIENTQVIVNDFPGSNSGVWNLINAYGFVEGLGTACTSSPAGGIGGTTSDNIIGNQANDRGMVWNDLKCAIHTLVSAQDQDLAAASYNGYARDSRIVYVGPAPADHGYGIIERDGVIVDPDFQTIPNANLNVCDYLVDLTEIPFTPAYYRVSGPNISLMEIISQVCRDAGCDYYIELLPIRTPGKVLKVIKVRVAVRSDQPQLDRVDDFIAAKQAESAQANGGVLEYTKGEEVRNEDTSSYLIGGKLRQDWVSEASDMLPFWGVDTNGDLIQAQVTGGEYEIRLDLSRLNITLNTPFASQFQWVTERELRAALLDIDSWKEVANFVDGDFATWLGTVKQIKRWRHDKLQDLVEGNLPGVAVGVGLNDVKDADHIITENAANDLSAAYEFVKAYADEFYGKQWLVNATSFVCFTTDAESQRLRYSHEPSTEGCWVADGTTTVIGLTHDSSASDFFRDDVGKYQPIVRFPAISAQRIGGGAASYTANTSRLGDDSYITDGVDEIWVKGELDERWVFGTPLVPSASTISFLVKTPAPITNNVSDTNNFPEDFGGLDILLDGNALAGGVANIKDRGAASLPALHFALAPNSALCPTLFNVQVYGPWGVVGLPGQVSLETDEGFVPWEYGSDNIMYQAAYDKVTDSVTQMRKGERGSITLAGFPNIPIGAELFSVDTASPPTSMGLQKYVGTRTYNVATCAASLPFVYVGMNAWEGDFGPSITSITVNVGEGGFTTSYQFSTYTPSFGRFSKDNSERLKRIGQTRLSNMRNLRAQQRLRRQVGAAVGRGRQIAGKPKGDRNPGSAHHLFTGRYVGENRKEINTKSTRELTLACSSDAVYAEVAVMSLDGLLRPVSLNGDGSLPQVINPGTQDCSSSLDNTDQPDPPISEYTRLSINTTYLNPLANPSESLPTDRSDTATSGHDIEVLGRNTTPPSSGWTIIEGDDGGEGYASDYRFMALKGPLMIQQWGYDLCGKPVPNKADSAASAVNGNFTSASLQDKFLDGWLKDPTTWPVAPLDLRLDRERGVWVTPQPPRNIHITPDGCLLTDSGVTIDNGKTVYDAAGSAVGSQTANAAWPWTVKPPTGIGKIPAYYDNVDCKLYAFPVNRFDSEVEGVAYTDVKKVIFNDNFTLDNWTDSDCTRTLSINAGGGSYITVSGHPECSQVGYKNTSVSTIEFGTGLCVTDKNGQPRVDSCVYLSASGDCYNMSSFPQAPFTRLNFGSGLTLSSLGDCAYNVRGGINIAEDNCFQEATALPYVGFTVGSGLVMESKDACLPTIKADFDVGIFPGTGTYFTHDEFGAATSDKEYKKITTGGACEQFLPAADNGDGPYCSRKPPKNVSTFMAGRGIGFTSCGSCDLVIFSAHNWLGYDDNCSAKVIYGQVNTVRTSQDFSLVDATAEEPEFNTDTSCTDFDGTRSVKLKLNEGGAAWSTDFVKCLRVTKSGSYVTDVFFTCGNFAGSSTCADDNPDGHSQKLWISSYTTGTEVTADGVAQCCEES